MCWLCTDELPPTTRLTMPVVLAVWNVLPIYTSCGPIVSTFRLMAECDRQTDRQTSHESHYYPPNRYTFEIVKSKVSCGTFANAISLEWPLIVLGIFFSSEFCMHFKASRFHPSREMNGCMCLTVKCSNKQELG